jgi:hypothetical protein
MPAVSLQIYASHCRHQDAPRLRTLKLIAAPETPPPSSQGSPICSQGMRSCICHAQGLVAHVALQLSSMYLKRPCTARPPCGHDTHIEQVS